MTPDVIADCKYRIDRLNQERNDRIERVDACLVALLSPLLPASPAPHINTESLGMAIDRLSILSLKIWHMDEQVRRTDVTPEHIASCEKKLAVLKEQRADLSLAVKHLVTEFVEGAKTPKLYFQFKMYNDPTLNPELYGNRGSVRNRGRGKEPFWRRASFPLPQTPSPILLRLLRFEFRASPASGIEKQKCLMPE